MKFFAIALVLLAGMLSPAFAQQAKGAPTENPLRPQVKSEPEGLSITDCLTILNGLNAMDMHQVIINAGKANEAVANMPYEFNNGALRGDIADNIAVLSNIQRVQQEAQQKIFYDVAKGDLEIKPGTEKAVEYDRQLRELTGRPCMAQLKKIKTSDLKLDKNEIPSSILAAISKIRE